MQTQTSTSPLSAIPSSPVVSQHSIPTPSKSPQLGSIFPTPRLSRLSVSPVRPPPSHTLYAADTPSPRCRQPNSPVLLNSLPPPNITRVTSSPSPTVDSIARALAQIQRQQQLQQQQIQQQQQQQQIQQQQLQQQQQVLLDRLDAIAANTAPVRRHAAPGPRGPPALVPRCPLAPGPRGSPVPGPKGPPAPGPRGPSAPGPRGPSALVPRGPPAPGPRGPPAPPQPVASIIPTFGALGSRKRRRPIAPKAAVNANGQTLEPTDNIATTQFRKHVRDCIELCRTHAEVLALQDPFSLGLVPDETRGGLQVIHCTACRTSKGWPQHPMLAATGRWEKRYTTTRTQIVNHVCSDGHLAAMRRIRLAYGPEVSRSPKTKDYKIITQIMAEVKDEVVESEILQNEVLQGEVTLYILF